MIQKREINRNSHLYIPNSKHNYYVYISKITPIISQHDGELTIVFLIDKVHSPFYSQYYIYFFSNISTKKLKWIPASK